MTRLKELESSQPEVRRNVARRVAQVIVGAAFIGLLLFASAGTLRWSWGWVYAGLTLATYVAGLLVLPLEVIAERGAKKANQEGWDKVVSSVLAPATFGIYMVAGLDFRFGWSPPFATGWHVAGVTAYVVGTTIMMWAMSANRFFSTTVRLQSDRGQTVCTGGPYRYVRHPGYVGMILLWTSTAVILGSFWALVPGVAVMIVLTVRTALEDRWLRERLPGYGEYAERVRYRLVPGVW